MLGETFALSFEELDTRHDFKGAKASLERLPKNEVQLKAATEERLSALRELFFTRLAKRGISLRNVDVGKEIGRAHV